MRNFPAAFLALLIGLTAGLARADSPVVFKVSVDPAARPAPATGRLIVMLKRVAAELPSNTTPLDGPFWDEAQPLYGMDVKELPAGTEIVVDENADGFPGKLSDLEPGPYYAQARLDVSRTSSSWKTQPGNLYSEPVLFGYEKGKPVEVRIKLDKLAAARKPMNNPRIEVVEVESKLLSAFYGTPTMLRAAVVKPVGFDASKTYAAIYHVPGFGGGIETALAIARQGDNPVPGTPMVPVMRSCFQIVLDAESPNGHTLFADSANNGPRGEALVKELIPAIEAKFPLEKKPEARLLRGHSSGGCATLWLTLNYPEMFGATWSSSPDPVDFRRLQLVNIYEDKNFYRKDGADKDTPSFRRLDVNKISVREDARPEDIIGPDNTSAQQWDSWFAVFGPRNERGHPAALYDPETGVIDHAIAEQYRKYDIADLVRKDPERYGKIFRTRIRLYVGDVDNFFLNEAVMLLKADLDKLYPQSKTPQDEAFGTINLVQGADHSSIYQSPDLRAIPQEMLEHLRRNQLEK